MNYTEDHLVEQPALQLMRHELGWDEVNCYDDPTSLKLRRTGWSGGVSNQGQDGKPSSPRLRRARREVVMVSPLRLAFRRLNPDLPVDHPSPRLRMAGAIEGAVEDLGILNDESVVAFGYAGTSSGVAGGYAGTSSWILNGRGRSQAVPRLNLTLRLPEGLICPPAKFWDHLREPAP